jgi:hypothetical protein
MSIELYDTNAWVGHWPFTPLDPQDLASLRRAWQRQGIGGGMVSDLDALWMVEPSAINRRLVESCRGKRNVLPVPILNLLDPAWEEQLAPWLSLPEIKVIRFAPTYGGWKMNHPRAVAAARLITESGRRVVLTARLLDERHEHPALKIKPVTVAMIRRWIDQVPGMVPLVQGLTRWELEELGPTCGRFMTDLSFAEWGDSIGVVGKVVEPKRIVFGSLSPLHNMAAHAHKVVSGPAPLTRRRAVAATNARKWLGL